MHKNLVREEDQSPRETEWALTKACGETKAAVVSFFPNTSPQMTNVTVPKQKKPVTAKDTRAEQL